MIKELTDTLIAVTCCLIILILVVIIYGLGYSNGEDNLIQKLCAQQQYDFCEVIEQKPIYILKDKEND